MENSTALPSFKEQLAFVYNDYMDTLGGGERSALAFARSLTDLGFTTEIITTGQVPAPKEIVRLFGDEFADISIRSVKTDDIYKFLISSEPTVFVNHTYMSFAPSPARVGIYAQMFPGVSISQASHTKEWRAINSYELMVCNSSFTRKYVHSFWEYPDSRTTVLNPPIGSKFVKQARSLLNRPLVKEKRFINIGRFNPGNHNKNQKILIEAFLEAKTRYPELHDWTLECVGNINNTTESLKYLDECKALASKAPANVRISNNISSEELNQRLLTAFGYVHGTGAFLLPGREPEKCEHFGLGIVEAMAHGCIPLVYARGGIFDVISPGQNGIPYITYEGLLEGFGEIARLWDAPERQAIQNSCLEAAAKVSQDEFTGGLLSHIKRVMFG